jgi:hypothetical protein
MMMMGQRDHTAISIVAPILRKGWERSEGGSNSQRGKSDYRETHGLTLLNVQRNLFGLQKDPFEEPAFRNPQPMRLFLAFTPTCVALERQSGIRKTRSHAGRGAPLAVASGDAKING